MCSKLQTDAIKVESEEQHARDVDLFEQANDRLAAFFDNGAVGDADDELGAHPNTSSLGRLFPPTPFALNICCSLVYYCHKVRATAAHTPL